LVLFIGRKLFTNDVPKLLDEVRVFVTTGVIEGTPVIVPDVAIGPLLCVVAFEAKTAGGQNVTA
jgi:hypothetical protein